MKKVLLGVAMAACLAIAACAPPTQSTTELNFTAKAQAQTITKVIDNGTAVREDAGFSVKTVYHGAIEEKFLLAAEKKKTEGGGKTSTTTRGGAGSGTQVPSANDYPLRL